MYCHKVRKYVSFIDLHIIFFFEGRIIFLSSNITKPLINMSTSWSLDPLLHDTLPAKASESIFTDLRTVQLVYLSIMILAIAYPGVHKVLLRFSQQYSDMKRADKQITTLHHAVEALILSIAMPFFSYYMIRVNFQVHNDPEVLLSDMRYIANFMFCITIMYLLELASRFQNPRPIIVFHHTFACFAGFMVLLFPTSVMVKTASVLVYFICFEALTFVGFFMYRIFPNSKYTPKVVLAGMICFGITRPLQVLWVGAAAFGSWSDGNTVKWQAIFQIVVTTILTALQVFTLKIHYRVWKRLCTKLAIDKNNSITIEGSSGDESGRDHVVPVGNYHGYEAETFQDEYVTKRGEVVEKEEARMIQEDEMGSSIFCA